MAPVHRTFDSVTHVVALFSDCLRALTPLVTKIGIEWEDGKNYDDWDDIAKALFASVVGNTIAYTVEGEGFRPLVPYGLVQPTYAGTSFLYSTEFGRSAAFIRLETRDAPFDTAVFALLDADEVATNQRVKCRLAGAVLSALLRSVNEEREVLKVIVGERQGL